MQSTRSRPDRFFLWLALILTFVYHSNLRPVASGDSLPTALLPFSLVLDHSLNLDRFEQWLRSDVPYRGAVTVRTNGHTYSQYPVGLPVLISPLYIPPAVAMSAWSPGSIASFARIYEKFVAVLLAVAAVLLLYSLLKRLTTLRWARWLALVFALGTSCWSTASQALFQHTGSQLLIVATLVAIERWIRTDRYAMLWLAGLAAGLAVTVRLSNGLLAAAVLAAMLVRRRPSRELAGFSVLPLAGAAALTAFNHATVGTIFGFMYHRPFTGDLLSGLAGILFSPGRGLLVYSPALVFALAGVPMMASARRSSTGFLALAAGLFALFHVLVVAKWHMWWGGYCWGPRLLTELMAPLVVLIAAGMPRIERHRLLVAALAVLAAVSIFFHAIGAYCYPKGHWDHLPVSVDVDQSRLWDWRDNPIARTLRGGIAYEPYVIVWEAVRHGLDPARQKMEELGVRPF